MRRQCRAGAGAVAVAAMAVLAVLALVALATGSGAERSRGTAEAAAQCGAQTFPVDLGNTHCHSSAKVVAATSKDQCQAACCQQGDTCDTWQWCEAGGACAKGFWPQSGALGRGGDLDGWPKNMTLGAASAACTASASCVGFCYRSSDLQPSAETVLKIYLKNSSSGPVSDPTWSRYMKASSGCVTGKLDRSCGNATTGWTSHAMLPRPAGVCDLLELAGTPCVAAHSVVRTLYKNYTGPLYRILRESDKAGLDIGARHSGFAQSAIQDSFCNHTSCYILRIFDQSPHQNHLDTAPAGGACRFPLSPVNATRHPISVGGNSAYGAYFEGKMGYRIDRTSGVATGDMEQTIYMVTRGDHVNAGCCFDYVCWLEQCCKLLVFINTRSRMTVGNFGNFFSHGRG